MSCWSNIERRTAACSMAPLQSRPSLGNHSALIFSYILRYVRAGIGSCAASDEPALSFRTERILIPAISTSCSTCTVVIRSIWIVCPFKACWLSLRRRIELNPVRSSSPAGSLSLCHGQRFPSAFVVRRESRRSSPPWIHMMLPYRRVCGVRSVANVPSPTSSESTGAEKRIALRVVPNNRQSKKPLKDIMAPAKHI